MSAASQLMQAVHAKLKGDALFMALLGSGVIADRLLEKKILPAVIFAEVESRDYSTASERGEEHFIRIDIWGEEASRKEAQALAARVKMLLVDAQLDLGIGQHLVSLLCLSERAGREKGKAEQSVSLRFRAVTEVLANGDEIDP